MKRRITVLLVLVLLLSAALPVTAYAADTAGYKDIRGHWAQPYLEQVIESGLMTGDTATTFHPNSYLTRADFVTVLGRFAGVNPDAWKMNYPSPSGSLFTDVRPSRYYAPYVNWAARTGITHGVGHGRFDPTAPVTREQMATMLQRYAALNGKGFRSVQEPVVFDDDTAITPYAKDAVSEMQKYGLIEGIEKKGIYYFFPRYNATRAQAAVLFSRMQDAVIDKSGWNETYVTLIMLNESTLSLSAGSSSTLRPQLFPSTATNPTVTWLSSDPDIATVDANGKVTAVKKGSCTVYAYSANGCKASCTVVCTKAAPKGIEDTDALYAPVSDDSFEEVSYYDPVDGFYYTEAPIGYVPQEPAQDLSLASAGEDYDTKCSRLFGGSVADPRTFFADEAAARENIVSISVPAWDIDENGEKYTRWFTLEVHKDLAATIDQIFCEIYACPAQYPFHSMGGFRFVSWSEHNFGGAIDVNPEENFYCDPEGNAVVGDCFAPEVNPYSIAVGGEIDQIFAKYGFTRGIYWHNGYRDYMHYSFFGT